MRSDQEACARASALAASDFRDRVAASRCCWTTSHHPSPSGMDCGTAAVGKPRDRNYLDFCSALGAHRERSGPQDHASGKGEFGLNRIWAPDDPRQIRVGSNRSLLPQPGLQPSMIIVRHSESHGGVFDHTLGWLLARQNTLAKPAMAPNPRSRSCRILFQDHSAD